MMELSVEDYDKAICEIISDYTLSVDDSGQNRKFKKMKLKKLNRIRMK